MLCFKRFSYTVDNDLKQGLESLTGTNTRSFAEIMFNSLLSAGVGAATAGFTKFLRIPGITSGSHSFTQVWKSGVTKTINDGFNMSLKTIVKGFVSSLVSEFTVGWLLSNIAQGGINAFRINMANMKSPYALLGI